MPFADDCQRHENGMVTAGPEAGPGPNADPDQAPLARLCAAACYLCYFYFDNQSKYGGLS
jgi:hypothetical protein